MNKLKHEQIFIFTGPTLSPADAKKHLDAVYLPPVKLGDIYRITELFKPLAIGIIDGYFNQVPAVWHKEILWAISRGVQVFGAASMGALRAAELDTLGMIGCGEIYRAYQRGVLPPFEDEPFEDDDEVAVIHSPAELGYLAASDAMVNIRFSLAAAAQQSIIDDQSCEKLVRIAKDLFYAERNYTSILKIAVKQGLPELQLHDLKTWLNHHSIDQKQQDAIALLNEISAHTDLKPSDKSEHRVFHHTSQWQSAIDEIDGTHKIKHPALDELRLQGEDYFQEMEQACSSTSTYKQHQMSCHHGDINQLHASPEKLQQLFAKLWQQKQGGLTPDQHLLAWLEQSGKLSALQARAQDKRTTLMRRSNTPDSTALNELEQLQLTDWYFTHKLNSEMPDRIDVYYGKLGLDDSNAFYDMILGEYFYMNSET